RSYELLSEPGVQVALSQSNTTAARDEIPPPTSRQASNSPRTAQRPVGKILIYNFHKRIPRQVCTKPPLNRFGRHYYAVYSKRLPLRWLATSQNCRAGQIGRAKPSSATPPIRQPRRPARPFCPACRLPDQLASLRTVGAL